MKRLRRILLNTLTAISLLLALATAGLWVRSGFLNDYVTFSYEQLLGDDGVFEEVRLDIRCAAAVVSYDSGTRPSSKFNFFRRNDQTAFDRGEPVYCLRNGSIPLEASGYSPSFSERVFGDGEAFHGRRTSPSSWLFGFPLWLPLLLMSILPLVRMMSAIRYRHGPGRCPACGYDMRANPAKCSECGHEIRLAGDNGDARG